MLDPYQISVIFKQVLIYIVYFFSAISFITAGFMFYHKRKIEIRRQIFDQLKSNYREQLIDELFREEEEIPIIELRSNTNFKAFSDISIELLETFNDSDYQKILHNQLYKSGAVDYYRSIVLENRNNNRCLDATDHLAMFRLDENYSLFITLIDNPKIGDDIQLSALTGLSMIMEPKEYAIFLSKLVHINRSGKFSEYLLGNLLQRVMYLDQPYYIHEIFQWLVLQENTLTLKAFIEALRIILYRPIIPELISLYFATFNIDLKISIMRTLGGFDKISNADIYSDALRSGNETLRVVASKSIASYAGDDLTFCAALHLCDESFYVRYNISNSLLSLPKGIMYLNDIILSSSDSYAVCSAKYALGNNAA